MAVAASGQNLTIVAGTRNSDAGRFGGVYTFDLGQALGSWKDSGIGNLDVLALAVSPQYETDRQLVALASNETDAIVISRVGSAGWGILQKPAAIRGLIPLAASVVLPRGFIALEPQELYVGLSTGTGGGDVYKVEWDRSGSGTILDLNCAVAFGLRSLDISALVGANSGVASTLVAGAASGSTIVVSSDNGSTWKKSSKEPTGQSVTGLLVDADFASTGRLCASTSGIESAFSRSDDCGVSWNQTAFVDTTIGSNGMVDLAVSGTVEGDSAIFLLTFGSKNSLWRTTDQARTWMRVFSSSLSGVTSLSMITYGKASGEGADPLYVSGRSGSSAVLWRSLDGGNTFAQRMLVHTVDAWSVLDQDSLWVASYDGSNGLIYSTANGGFFFTAPVRVCGQPLKSVAVSPAMAHDKTILAGSTVGKVYLSTDNGGSFKQMGQQLPLSVSGSGWC